MGNPNTVALVQLPHRLCPQQDLTRTTVHKGLHQEHSQQRTTKGPQRLFTNNSIQREHEEKKKGEKKISSLSWRNTYGGVFIEKKKKKRLDEGINSDNIGKRRLRIQGRLRERRGGTIEDERGRHLRVSANEKKSSFMNEEKTGRVLMKASIPTT
ncbi:hypothetical protein Salat_1904400 [Sesamum alatum]|uniref:Uncharacterized protein n=1 Tax=Sesamum alatum TaxID=300844 RepID=A0AAE2CIA7_9LAMI|nr:hypothetical protein Salat_1904400 [Sesamum alatum]